MITVRIINRSGNPLPEYQTSHSAGMDLHASLQDPCTLAPLERKLIPTGLSIALPDDCEAQIRPRSGLAFKYGITVLNSPGTIDADYRGEIKVLLVNLSNETFTVNNGDRIAQMIFAKVESAQWQLVEELEATQRGEGGYGHTGK